MKGFLGKLFSGRKDDDIVTIDMPPIAVDRPFVAIGDVHGCAALMDKMLLRLAQEAPEAELLFLGDYIDRGEENAEVLRRLVDLENATCLMGNHERMCLDFLNKPEERGDRWLRNGGLQTLASFGVSSIGQSNQQMRDQLALAMGDRMIDWMIDLPLFAMNGNVASVHAVGDPTLPIPDQGEKPLIWGHPLSRKSMRADGVWVVHGHWISGTPHVESGRISVDSGAYATGQLSAAIFRGDEVEFIQVGY